MKTEITRKDEERFLKLKIADNPVFNNALTFDEIISLIYEGSIPLQVSDDDGTKVLDDEHFNEIKRVIPFLLKIIDKPRSFIKSLEEKVLVETAKRINHKAISKLSQDSNDWYARTILSVKPKNIVADINEETIDLYENRFICSLTDRIAKLVASRRQYYQDTLKTIDDNSAIWIMDKDYHTTNSFQFFNKITKYSNTFFHDNNFRDKVVSELQDIENVEKKIRIIKRSEFYRILHKKRKVVDPIQKTNILMFEFNYNQAYKLWKYLNQIHQEEKLENKVEIIESELNGYYTLYCLLSVFSSIHDIGFKEISKNTIQYLDNKIKINDDLIFLKDGYKLTLGMRDNEIHLFYNYDEKKNFLDEFVFVPNYINFENLNRIEVSDYTEKVLNELSIREKHTNITSKYAFVSLNINRCSENNTYSDKVYKRFYGIGTNYSPEEKNENLLKWADYKTGISIISPVNLRNNFLRIERIINYHLIRNINILNSLKKCPLCGGIHIVALNNQNYSCHDCNYDISITYCNSCDPNKNRPIIWIKYSDDKFLQSEDVIHGDFAKNKIYDKISKIETIMGEKTTTSFELYKDTTRWKLKTLCPHCGIKLGDITE